MTNPALHEGFSDLQAKKSTCDQSVDIRHLVFIEPDAAFSQANGIHVVVSHLAREQLFKGQNVRIVLLCPSGHPQKEQAPGIPTTSITLAQSRFIGKYGTFDSKTLNAILDGCSERTFFHIHDARRPLLLLLTREMSRRNIRYGMTIHGRYSHIFDEHSRIKKRSSALYLSLAERYALERACFVQAVSPSELKLIQRIAPRASSEFIPNAVYSSAIDGFPPAPQFAHDFTEYPIFGYCGRYAIEHKGLDLLIKGFAQYVGSGAPGRLALIGSGSGRVELQALVNALGISQRVDVGGPLFDDEKIEAMHHWHYFIQPSRFDGMPMGAMEAAILGLPLIVSGPTGLRDFVEASKAGFGIDTLSPEGIARALHEAAQHGPDAWAKMSQAAYEMTIGIGDWTKIAARLEALYSTVSKPRHKAQFCCDHWTI